ncbi:Glutathione S-transferase D7 [Cryptotermes secundus]|uniref:Glutathione S-transferase D7 n=1 Tax=Cryptotermes secundus TaxID=105785 RepID=A0A2J7Q2Y1_9NEOP|nr:glutathione S-transferase D7 [Cryptotermes secundus]PNF22939.1 Glutathione S-transferase D7 [Cryptotermes secundus]
MPMDFYYLPPSPPCRSVLLLAKRLGIEFNLKKVNILTGEQLTPEFIKLNPQHTVPTLDDNGFVLWESRAILGYLVNQYGKDESLYPTEPKKRAIVDQRLYFDAGTLHTRNAHYMEPVFFFGEAPKPEKLEKINEALGYLNLFLEGQDWVAGDNITIADICLVVSVSNSEAIGADISVFPNLVAWYEKMKTELEDYEEINQTGANVLGEMFRSKLT